MRSVLSPAYIIPDAVKYVICRTIENNECADRCEAGHVCAWPAMSRDAVQDEQIVLRERGSLQEQSDDLFCQRKVLIFEKKAALENTVDKIEFF